MKKRCFGVISCFFSVFLKITIFGFLGVRPKIRIFRRGSKNDVSVCRTRFLGPFRKTLSPRIRVKSDHFGSKRVSKNGSKMGQKWVIFGQKSGPKMTFFRVGKMHKNRIAKNRLFSVFLKFVNFGNFRFFSEIDSNPALSGFGRGQKVVQKVVKNGVFSWTGVFFGVPLFFVFFGTSTAFSLELRFFTFIFCPKMAIFACPVQNHFFGYFSVLFM